MTIFLDPYRDGCHVLILGRNTVQSIRGTYEEISHKIYKFCTQSYYDINDKLVIEQCVDIIIDANGFGIALKDYLEELGLKLQLVKPEKVLRI